jgi:hypothetical protein
MLAKLKIIANLKLIATLVQREVFASGVIAHVGLIIPY